jgi:hypothetical protein
MNEQMEPLAKASRSKQNRSKAGDVRLVSLDYLKKCFV